MQATAVAWQGVAHATRRQLTLHPQRARAVATAGGGLRLPADLHPTFHGRPHFALVRKASLATGGADAAAFVGITPGLTKEEQIAQKNQDVDKDGIWDLLPAGVQQSLQDSGKARFVSWLGHGVTRGKAAIVQLFTHEEADAITSCMGITGGKPGVMSAERTAQLYMGRVNTARHLVADTRLAEHLLRRFQACMAPAEGEAMPFLSEMKFGADVVAVNEKIRLVTTEEGGEHQKHADISEPSDDGQRISRLTFQCYLNPEAYEGGHFQLYPQERGGDEPVDIFMEKGCAVVFVQEDPELMHGGGKKGVGAAKRAIRGNLDVPA